MQNIKLPIVVVIALAVGAGSFYGGMVYGKSKTADGRTGGNFQGFANLTPEQRQQFRANGGRMAGNGRGANMVAGEAIKRDDTSVTLKLRDGGSKLVILSDKTEVMKSVKGASSDIAVGNNLMITGTANADGSVIAQNIQIRSDVPLGQMDPPGDGTPRTETQPAK